MPKCLLVIDPVPTNRIRLAAMFEAAQYDVVTLGTPQELTVMPQISPDLVVFGLHSNAPHQSLQALKSVGLPVGTPVLCIDTEASPLRRLQALRAGAREFMTRSTPDALLLARVRGLLREGDAERECERRRVTASSFGFSEACAPFSERARVACVMGPGAPERLPDILGQAVAHKLDILDVHNALRDDPNGAPDAYIVAPGSDDDALETILPELRVRDHSRHAPVLVIYDQGNSNHAVRALNLGASDIAADTSSSEELSLRLDAMLRRKRLRDMLRQTDEQSYQLAVTDPLTGLYNRRYAEAYLADLLMREQEQGRGYVLMLVDLDHFKRINDTHGHAAGDQVLLQSANRLRSNLRAGDLVCRYGGEEFLIVLPDASPSEGEFTAERIRKAIGTAPMHLENGVSIPVTASIGVGFGIDEAQSQPLQKTGTFDMAEPAFAPALSRLVDAADAALYRAKNAGRNRVEFSVS